MGIHNPQFHQNLTIYRIAADAFLWRDSALSVPRHGRQTCGGCKIIERRVRIDSQADLWGGKRDHISLHSRRQYIVEAALLEDGADYQRAVERPVGAFERQAVAIKNHQPVKFILALF